MGYDTWFEFSSREIAVRHRVNGLSRHILDSIIGVGADGDDDYAFYVDTGYLKHYPFSAVVDGFYMEFPDDTSDDITFGVLGATNAVYVLYTPTYEPTDPTKLMAITPSILVQDTGLAAPSNSYAAGHVAGSAQGSFIAMVVENSQRSINFTRRINVPELYINNLEFVDSDLNFQNVGTVGRMEPTFVQPWTYSESGLSTAIAAAPSWTKLASSGYKFVGDIPVTYNYCLVMLHIECENTDFGVGAT